MLLSRVAETLYWTARYVERAENTARIIMVNANLLLDLPKGISPGWEPILKITGSSGQFLESHTEITERNVVKFLISDRKNPSSIYSSLSIARENLRTARAIFPQGAWEILNDLYYFVDEKKTQGWSQKGRYEYLKTIIRNCQMINGNMSGSMCRDQTYDFLRIGRNIERADMTTRVLEVRAGNLLPNQAEELKPFDDIQWKSVLETLAAYQMYRRHVHVRVKGSAVLDYLVKDKLFPRSVSFCIGEVENCLHNLSGNDAALRIIGRINRLAGGVDVNNHLQEKLFNFTNEMQIVLGQLHDQISSSYFQVRKHKNDSADVVHQDSNAKVDEAAA